MTEAGGSALESWSQLRDRRMAEPGAQEAYEAARIAQALDADVTPRVDPRPHVRVGEASEAAFVVEMARLASVIEDDPLPAVDDPVLRQGLPPSPKASVVAVDDDGLPVGAAWWHFRQPHLLVGPEGVPVPEIVVAVIPVGRGRGIGRRLLDALAAQAVDHGFDRLSLNVHIRNPATRLYSRSGFVVAGKGRGPLGVAMVRRLGGAAQPGGRACEDARGAPRRAVRRAAAG